MDSFTGIVSGSRVAGCTTKKKKSCFVRRCVVLLIAFLAVYVLFTLYIQLTEVMVLNRTAVIMGYSHVAHSTTLGTAKNTAATAGDFNKTSFDRGLSKHPENYEPDLGTENIHFTGHEFKSHVRQKVFTRNFYEKFNSKVDSRRHSRGDFLWTLQRAKTRSWPIMSAKSMQSRAGQSHAGQSRAEQSHAGQSHAEQSHAEQSRAEQSHAGQSHAEQSRAEQSHAEQSRAEQSHAGQSHAGQSRAGQSHAGQSHTGQSHTGHPRASRETRKSVMILAYLRSGSSFVGEMFNRNPKVFYLFEPLYPIWTFLGGKRTFSLLYDTFVRHFLGSMFECSFNKNPFFVNFLSTSGFRLKSRILSSPVFCDPRVTSLKMHLCRRINTTLLTRLCRSSSHTVVKTIRVSNWENIDAITETNLLDPTLKLIHLVRDPRAIITSRVSHHLAKIEREKAKNTTEHDGNASAMQAMMTYVRSSSALLCDRMRNDIFNGKKITALGKTYALVRYEDVARSPLGAYEEICNFTGIAQSEHVVKWLEVNTVSNSDPGYFSTSRNSSAAAHMWRLKLPMTLVTEVQKECSEVMRILGYSRVCSDAELRDMSKSLVVEWDNGGLLRTNVAV